MKFPCQCLPIHDNYAVQELSFVMWVCGSSGTYTILAWLYVTLHFSTLCSPFYLTVECKKHPESPGVKSPNKLLLRVQEVQKVSVVQVWLCLWCLPTKANCTSFSLCKPGCSVTPSQAVPHVLWKVRVSCVLQCPEAITAFAESAESRHLSASAGGGVPLSSKQEFVEYLQMEANYWFCCSI